MTHSIAAFAPTAHAKRASVPVPRQLSVEKGKKLTNLAILEIIFYYFRF